MNIANTEQVEKSIHHRVFVARVNRETLINVKNYKEFMAPIVHNSGLMLTVGYQVSRDETKRW
jgi:hypothetical protein